MRELASVYRAVAKARREVDPLAKSRRLRELLERADCHFGYKELRGGRRQAVLERVDFHPLKGGAWAVPDAATGGPTASRPR